LSLSQLRKYLKEEKIPAKISNYILGESSSLNYKLHFSYWKDVAEYTIKLFGIEDQYSIRALRALYEKDYWSFGLVILNNFKNTEEEITKLIKLLKENMNLELNNFSGTIYYAYNIKEDMINNFTKILYNKNKDDLRKMFLSIIDIEILLNILPLIYKLDYDYYEEDIKNHLSKYIDPYQELYKYFKYIKDISFREELILKKMKIYLLESLYKKEEVNNILNYIKGKENIEYRKEFSNIFPSSFKPKQNNNLSEFEKRIIKLSSKNN